MSTIDLHHDLLSRMAGRTCAEVPANEIVFFGIRGALPMDPSGTGFAASHQLRLTEFNHLNMRCTLGQWRPADKTIAVFPGSTVPHRDAVQTAKAAGGIGANMLMLGRYRYQKGVHKASSPNGHRAFRQAMFFPVWRTKDDLDFDLADRLDLGSSPDEFVFDNLHCAFQDNLDSAKYSSNGCQVVAGRPMSRARGNKPETGPWARFIEHAYGASGGGQTHYRYFLFSGAEAGMVSSKPNGPLSRSLRFGSSGEWVEKVQAALQKEGFDFLDVDGGFGRDTLQALMAFQNREFGAGQADGVVGPNTAGALEIDWPPIGGAAATPAAAPAAPAPAAPAPPPAPAPVPAVAAAAGSAIPAGWQASATAITPGFEVAGDPYLGVTGDFDGMGISCGALQWNIGQGSLQPMVKAVGETVVKREMPTLGAKLWKACNDTIANALKAVRTMQTGSTLSAVAKKELRALMGSAEMRAEQDRRIGKIADSAFAAALDWAQDAGRAAPSKREFLWFFDLVTQNGGLKGITREDVNDFITLNGSSRADDVVCDFLARLTGTSGHIKDANKNAALWRNKADGEKLELLVLSFLRSGEAIPKFRHVVLNRKGAIAMGEGFVNSSKLDFSTHGI